MRLHEADMAKPDQSSAGLAPTMQQPGGTQRSAPGIPEDTPILWAQNSSNSSTTVGNRVSSTPISSCNSRQSDTSAASQPSLAGVGRSNTQGLKPASGPVQQ